MTYNQIGKAKADTKKAMSDIENRMAHARADVNADVEKIKANFGHGGSEKKVAYAKADLKAAASKAKSDVENKLSHAKVDAQKARADIGKKMSDMLK